MARIVLDNVRVDFPVYGVHQRSLRNALVERATGGLIQKAGGSQDRVVVRALSDFSMIIEEGDRVGLIGHNGSGKSTLLKVIAGIYEPIQGQVQIDGRVTPLIDMMPGLDSEDTGYENIITSGMLLGLSREIIECKVPEIEEFCELGAYLELPLRTYSAGMIARLSFALVTALNPDVVVLDEGFGAADLRFTEKASKRMDEFIGRSRIIVLASHSDALVRSICNKAALLHEGRLVEFGPIEQVLERYHASVAGQASSHAPATDLNTGSNGHAAEDVSRESTVPQKDRGASEPTSVGECGRFLTGRDADEAIAEFAVEQAKNISPAVLKAYMQGKDDRETIFGVIYAASREPNQPIHVLDFGGACGFHSKLSQFALPHISFRWAVVESPLMVQAAREFASDDLRFFDNVSAALEWIGTPDLLHASGISACLGDPEATMFELCNVGAPTMVWSRTMFSPMSQARRLVHAQKLSEMVPGPLPSGLVDQVVELDLTEIPFEKFLDCHASRGYQLLLSYGSARSSFLFDARMAGSHERERNGPSALL